MADEIKDGTPPVQVYIENVRNASIGGFTIPLPITKEALAPWLSAIEADADGSGIAIKSIRSPVFDLEETLSDVVPADDALDALDALDELNYLARLLTELDEDDICKLLAAIESSEHCDSVADIINLAKNMGHFGLMSAFDEEAYGGYLIESFEYEGAYTRLKTSQAPDDRALADYIESLERHVDRKSYGCEAIEKGGGTLTSRGLLFISGNIEELYRGVQDIPDEFCLFGDSLPELLKTTDVKPLPFLMKLHAVAGDYINDARDNLEVVTALRTGEYLLLLDGKSAHLTEAAHAYQEGAATFDAWTHADKAADTQAFAIHTAEVFGKITGDIEEIDLIKRQRDIIDNSICPVAIEATMKNGEVCNYTPQEWEALSLSEKDRVKSWWQKFKNEDHYKVNRHLEDIRDGQKSARAVDENEFLATLNAGYMGKPQYVQDGFVRVSNKATKEILAYGDAEVYWLLPEGPLLLASVEATKSNLWLSPSQQFAIRRKDLPKLDGWAERASAELLRQAERAGHQKSNELGL